MAETLWRIGNAIMESDDPAYQLLKLRGITDPKAFIKITKKKLHNPYKMKDMKKAVTKIEDAIKRGLKIGIFGDYDADGVSSTSLFVLVLRDLGAEVVYFVPDRFKDGYGVNRRALDQFKADGVEFIITCDTGITAVDQIAYAKSLGMDIVVTDHHEPQDVEAFDDQVFKLGQVVASDSGEQFLIPDTIVVNPKRPDCKYPFKSLSGVGVVFKLLCALCEKIHPAGRSVAYQYMDLVTIGTIADVMDIVDENRIICKLGLKMMNTTKNCGLYQLLRANDLIGKRITSKDIGWSIGPCINAAGRIVSATTAVDMLISNDKLSAFRLAKRLVEINEERKELTKTYVEPIIRAITAEQDNNPTAIVVHYHPQVPEGIIGLLAGRISNHFYKPAILLSDADEDGIYKGSGRSIEGFDLFNALMGQASLMTNFGGHAAACGLSLEKQEYEALKHRLEFFAEATILPENLQKKIFIDCVVNDPTILDIDFVEDMNRLEPFGNGNQRPMFMMSNMRIIREMPVGPQKNHLWALMIAEKQTFGTIGFSLYEKYESLGKPKNIDVVFSPSLNEYPKGSGKINVQLEIEDIRKHQKKKKVR